MADVQAFEVWDADNHMYETIDAYTRYLPEKYSEALKFVDVNGRKKLQILGVITETIPNPTYEVIPTPGAWADYFRGINPEGKTLRELPVSGAMAQKLLACKANDALADVEKTMRAARIRRLPVVDEQGSLIGIIGLADLAREAARERSASKKDITESEVGDTLAAICEANTGQRVAA